MIRSLCSAAVLLGAAALAASSAIAAIPCGKLTGLAVPNNTTVDTATSVPAGPFIRPGATTPTNVPIRLFMAPGMTHCAGGPGLNTFDTLTALERWVEEGRAPDKLIASHTALAFPDNVMWATPPPGDFSRPLCPWPQVVHFNARGSKTDAGSFVCARSDRHRDDD